MSALAQEMSEELACVQQRLEAAEVHLPAACP
jgi:hypothetical protein|eukprot:COSAG01_NODE_2708_length_7219_cov_2.933146_12_plen_32_part_00